MVFPGQSCEHSVYMCFLVYFQKKPLGGRFGSPGRGGAEGPGGCLQRIGNWGANCFFLWAETPTKA